jgi:hypothetical protein
MLYVLSSNCGRFWRHGGAVPADKQVMELEEDQKGSGVLCVPSAMCKL